VTRCATTKSNPRCSARIRCPRAHTV
jgi:hypothetical protein